MTIILQYALICFAIGQTKTLASRTGIEPDVRCGGFCLFIALEALDAAPASYAELEKSLGGPGPEGYSMLQLEAEAKRRGLKTLGIATNLENLLEREQSFACITRLQPNHFVLLSDVRDANVHLIDAPKVSSLSRTAFKAIWDGQVLLLSKAELTPLQRRPISYLGYPLAIIALALILGAVIVFRRQRRFLAATACFIFGFLSITGCDKKVELTHKVTIAAETQLKEESKLEVMPKRVDLGKVFRSNPGQSVYAMAELRNNGREPLRIQSVSVGCDCTRVELDPTTIPGYSVVPVRISLRLGDSTERRSTYVRFQTDEPQSSAQVLAVDWQTVNPLRTERESIHLASMTAESTQTFAEPIFLEGMGLCGHCQIEAKAEEDLVRALVSLHDASNRDEHSTPLNSDPIELGKLSLTILPQLDERLYRDRIQLTLRCNGELRAKYSLR